MLKYTDFIENEKQFLSLTSLTPNEFRDLLKSFSAAWSDSMIGHTQAGKIRTRLYGESSVSKLPTAADKLFFILYYFKNQPLQEALGASFNMSQSQANKFIHRLKNVLHKVLKNEKVIPVRTQVQFERKKVQEKIYYTDATERAIPRSVDIELQKEYYSGKQKKHTVKNGIFSVESGEIVFLTDTVQGKMHDKKLNESAGIRLPKSSILFQDTGYVGYCPEGKDITIVMPHKKRKGKELTEEQKDLNKRISSTRVKVEHVMSGIKRLRIVKDKVRVWADDFWDQIMEIACGLHNFRLKIRPWIYPETEIEQLTQK